MYWLASIIPNVHRAWHPFHKSKEACNLQALAEHHPKPLRLVDGMPPYRRFPLWLRRGPDRQEYKDNRN
ncbi:hypothetical protein D3C81_775130 [compost metagenome]